MAVVVHMIELIIDDHVPWFVDCDAPAIGLVQSRVLGCRAGSGCGCTQPPFVPAAGTICPCPVTVPILPWTSSTDFTVAASIFCATKTYRHCIPSSFTILLQFHFHFIST